MNYILTVSLGFEALPVLVGILSWTKVKTTYFKWFLLYLSYIFLGDCIGTWYIKNIGNNEWIYDYFIIPVEFLFLFWLFSRSIKNRKYFWTPIACAMFYFISIVVENMFLKDSKYAFDSFSYSIGNLLLLILLLQYFFQLTNSKEVLNFRHNMMFWISSGLMVYYLGTCPYFGLKNYLHDHYYAFFYTYYYIVLVLDCMMYLLFSIGFICMNQSFLSLSGA